jgi:LysR family nitrogen assimilation transcriptional regulator
MDLVRLQTFVAVAQAGSMSRAAAALHISQPALSRQVHALEEELGQRLLERTGRGVVPTESGLALLGHADEIFARAQVARADMLDRQANPRGRVVVGLPPRVAYVLTADLVEQFSQRFPDATITVEENLSIRLRESLVAGRADLALMFDPPNSPQMTTDTLLREPLVLISTTPLPARIRLDAVAARKLVMPSGPNALRQLLESHMRARGMSLRVLAEVDSVQTVLSLVARGVADTVLPLSAVRIWTWPAPYHVATLAEPAIRNRLVLGIARARPATQLSRFTADALRALVPRHFG